MALDVEMARRGLTAQQASEKKTDELRLENAKNVPLLSRCVIGSTSREPVFIEPCSRTAGAQKTARKPVNAAGPLESIGPISLSSPPLALFALTG